MPISESVRALRKSERHPGNAGSLVHGVVVRSFSVLCRLRGFGKIYFMPWRAGLLTRDAESTVGKLAAVAAGSLVLLIAGTRPSCRRRSAGWQNRTT